MPVLITIAPVLAAVAGCQQRANLEVDLQQRVTTSTLIQDAITWESDAQPIEAATTPADADTLTLAGAVNLAVRNSPAVQVALWKVRAAEADADQSRLLPNPVLTATYRFAEAGGPPAVEVGLAADLLAFLTRGGKTASADARLRMTLEDALTAVLDTIADTQERYVTAASIEDDLQVLADRDRILRRQLDVATARFRAGDANRLDVTTLESQRLTLETERTDRELARRDERLRLARLIGAPGGRSDWKLEPSAAPPPLAAAETQWIDAALEHRPEVQSARWELAALSGDLKLARSTVLQGLDLGVASQRDPNWQVGPTLTVPLPIFDTGQAHRDKAFADAVGARHKLLQTQRGVVEEIRRAYAAYEASRLAVTKARNELLPLLDRRHQQAEAAYRAGESDLATLLLAEEDMAQGRATLNQLRLKSATARLRLERAAGGPGRSPGK
jgi:cobalt-zinc-cadmium efflux system outer membrane protein